MNLKTDEELYNLFLSGVTSAFDELMIRYGDNLVYFLNGYLHSWQDAEDLMIEAFARIMVKKPHIHGENIKPYLYKTARNLATRHHDQISRRKEFLFDEEPDEISEKGSAEEHTLKEEQKAAVRLCMERIEPEVKEAVWLVYFEEMSYKQAAEVMKTKEKRIEYLLSKGKKLLQKELEKEGITDAD